MKALRYTLFGLLGLVLLLLAVATVFLLTFDPRQYKDDIQQLVSQYTGRTLILSDDIQMSLYPNLGVSLGPTTLTEKDQKSVFVSVESAQVSVAVLPLLKRQILVDGVRLTGLVANVTRDKQGQFNFDDLIQQADKKDAPNQVELTSKDGSATNITFDVAGVEIKGGVLTYQDHTSNQRIEIKALNLKTGQLAPHAKGELAFSGHVIAPSVPMDAQVAVGSRYELDLPTQKFSFGDLTFNLNGTALAVPNLTLTTKTSVEADIKNARFDLKNIEIDATSKALFKASLRSAGLIWSDEKFSLQQLAVSANLDQPRQKFGLQLQAPEVSGTTSQVSVAKYTSTLQLDMPDVLRTPLKIPMQGDLHANLAKQSAQASVDARVDNSRVQASIQLPQLSPLAVRADIKIDQIDLDRYLQATAPASTASTDAAAANNAAAKSPPAVTPAAPIDLSALNSLDAQIKLAIDQVRVYGVPLTQVKTDIQAKNGQLRVGPHSANVANGTIQGDLTVNTRGNQFALKESINNIAIGTLLKELGQASRIDGTAQLNLTLNTQGKTTPQLKQNLAGQVGFKVADGAIQGIDLARLLRSIQGVLASGKLPEFSPDDKTVFSELSGTATIKQGVATNKDLDMKAPIFRLQGQGDINLATNQIDYLAKVAVVESTQGQGGPELQALRGITIPVRLIGPFDKISYQLDIPLIAAEIAKSRAGQVLTDKIDKAINPETKEKVEKLLGPDITNKLKGLFGG